ncbi:hypothetical protein B4135_1854 [Caldibacillus debilis]|uniref:Uncharacterized protein n=1 Tax=Caldibacillus debilis TaxID=301148 RepID=A0A150M7T0_9BACI|nr:hypothetical protein B4135_1854 [Caldibacillus debilis]
MTISEFSSSNAVFHDFENFSNYDLLWNARNTNKLPLLKQAYIIRVIELFGMVTKNSSEF